MKLLDVSVCRSRIVNLVWLGDVFRMECLRIKAFSTICDLLKASYSRRDEDIHTTGSDALVLDARAAC